MRYCRVTVLERPDEELRVCLFEDHVRGISDVALWSLGRLRKAARCAVTGRDLARGEEVYRPVGNQQYRYERISKEALQ